MKPSGKRPQVHLLLRLSFLLSTPSDSSGTMNDEAYWHGSTPIDRALSVRVVGAKFSVWELLFQLIFEQHHH